MSAQHRERVTGVWCCSVSHGQHTHPFTATGTLPNHPELSTQGAPHLPRRVAVLLVRRYHSGADGWRQFSAPKSLVFNAPVPKAVVAQNAGGADAGGGAAE